MAKKDLKEATKDATAGMFTLNSEKDSTSLVKQKKEMIKDNESDGKRKKKTQRMKKPANDYLYLDLRPAGYDLKSYVMKQAHRTSMEQGRNISATNYIQSLIKKDMDKERENTVKAKIISIIENASEEKLDVIYTILKNII